MCILEIPIRQFHDSTKTLSNWKIFLKIRFPKNMICLKPRKYSEEPIRQFDSSPIRQFDKTLMRSHKNTRSLEHKPYFEATIRRFDSSTIRQKTVELFKPSNCRTDCFPWDYDFILS